MPIKKQHDPTINLTTVICTGEISFDEIMYTMIRYYQGIDGPPTKMVLWDLSRASAENISANELEEIAQLRLDNDKQMTSGKTAVVAPSDINFGLSRMFLSKTVEARRYLRVFRTLDEAEEWLGI